MSLYQMTEEAQPTLPNKTGVAHSRHAWQLERCGFSFITVAFRSPSPAAVADLSRWSS